MKEISYSNSEDESVQEMQAEVLVANEKNQGNKEEGRCPSSDFFMDC